MVPPTMLRVLLTCRPEDLLSFPTGLAKNRAGRIGETRETGFLREIGRELGLLALAQVHRHTDPLGLLQARRRFVST
jgi:hypothetical protein